eukprot:7137385-Pyramimonas_sp.AAC.1
MRNAFRTSASADTVGIMGTFGLPVREKGFLELCGAGGGGCSRARTPRPRAPQSGMHAHGHAVVVIELEAEGNVHHQGEVAGGRHPEGRGGEGVPGHRL